jgi:hypothetical protein
MEDPSDAKINKVLEQLGSSKTKKLSKLLPINNTPFGDFHESIDDCMEDPSDAKINKVLEQLGSSKTKKLSKLLPI